MDYQRHACLAFSVPPSQYCRYGNINPFPIGYAFQPHLRGRLTLGKITFTLESLGFRRTGISPVFSLLMPAFSLPLPPATLTGHLHRHVECSPTNRASLRDSIASVYRLAPLHCLRMTTRPVSYYALFKGVAASKPTSWLSSQSHIILHLAVFRDLS